MYCWKRVFTMTSAFSWQNLLWLSFFILSGVISPLFSSSILGDYQPGELIFQHPIFLPFHTVHEVLKARILKWFAIPFSKPDLIWNQIYSSYDIKSPNTKRKDLWRILRITWNCSITEVKEIPKLVEESAESGRRPSVSPTHRRVLKPLQGFSCCIEI